MSDPTRLDIPPAVSADPKAVEILNIWMANNQQYIIFRTDVWEDPAAWGLMLADIARHVAQAYHQEEGRDVQATLARIMAGLHAELD